MLGPRYSEALVYAAALHRAQRRKGSDTPYLAHLLAVSSLVIEAGGDEDQAIAGLLHDAVEDQGGAHRAEEIASLFGPGVATIVLDCTDATVEPKPAWRPRKEAYLAALPAKPARSLLVSAADKLHNAVSIRRDLVVTGPAVWERFTGGRDGSLWYYRALADVFATALPGPLASELCRAVAEIEAAA